MQLKSLPDWSGETIVVVASGQSATDVIDDVSGYPTIAINRSHEICDADILYAADTGFWLTNEDARKFAGIKCAPDQHISRYCPDVVIFEILKKDHRSVHEMIYKPFGVIGHGGNSGFQAVNIAAQMRPKQILLVGFDYHGKHWHEDHPPALRNPTQNNFETWVHHLDRQADLLKSWGIDVVNLSSNSALRNYRYESSVNYKEPTSLSA